MRAKMVTGAVAAVLGAAGGVAFGAAVNTGGAVEGAAATSEPVEISRAAQGHGSSAADALEFALAAVPGPAAVLAVFCGGMAFPRRRG